MYDWKFEMQCQACQLTWPVTGGPVLKESYILRGGEGPRYVSSSSQDWHMETKTTIHAGIHSHLHARHRVPRYGLIQSNHSDSVYLKRRLKVQWMYHTYNLSYHVLWRFRYLLFCSKPHRSGNISKSSLKVVIKMRLLLKLCVILSSGTEEDWPYLTTTRLRYWLICVQLQLQT